MALTELISPKKIGRPATRSAEKREALANVTPRNERYSTEITDELKSVIHTHLSEKLGSLSEGAGRNIHPDDRDTIIMGLALRLDEKSIANMVNTQRQERGEEAKMLTTNIHHMRKRYAEVIDEVWAVAIIRIGEIYKYSDKLYRISRYNNLADVLERKALTHLELDTDLGPKLTNLLIRTFDRINIEMGGKPVSELITRLPQDGSDKDEDDKDVVFTKEEAKRLLAEEFSSRYSNQLPPAITQKISFTDYTGCANGEKMGELTVCWNEKMTDNNAGSQCAVQKGTCKQCPKFLNKYLLNDKDYMTKVREQGISILKIAILLGATEYDFDIRNRICWYLKKHDIIWRMPNSVSVRKAMEDETIEDIDEPTDTDQSVSEEQPEVTATA